MAVFKSFRTSFMKNTQNSLKMFIFPKCKNTRSKPFKVQKHKIKTQKTHIATLVQAKNILFVKVLKGYNKRKTETLNNRNVHPPPTNYWMKTRNINIPYLGD